ncbi:hypothetical protein D9758_009037 [Tetrapyrgos nigripes]|uniref:GMC oxidoreductase n=1 Tax=Tetrapyrgos nigripes TaxID=182062 RepID=A0A8H5G9Y5_9AGAR|nr:hypothetical protein D9758_009037 [Tetrapyrgos nigripes]
MMWSSLVLTTLLTLSFNHHVSATSSNSRVRRNANKLKARAAVTNILNQDSSIKSSYDFVIVGGGLAGLAVASRLSEDSNTTVLVVEAGQSGDDVKTQINTPADTYYDSLTGTEYDYSYSTASQSNLNNRECKWPRGKVLGGSSAINGMYMVRPNQLEIDAWASIASSSSDSSSSSWAWNSFYSAMKKAETFDAPSDDVAKTAGIVYNEGSYGNSGPIHWGYPGYTFPVLADWSPTLSTLGVPLNSDPTSGNNTGSFIANSAIRKSDWTRSYSRSAYIDSVQQSRTNLDILAGATVTSIVWDSSADSDGNLKATGVQYAFSSGGAKKTVKANKEVILAGGTIGSAQVLMVSGVGPKDVLDGAGVSVKIELPGVGQRLQDHLSASTSYSTTITTAGKIHNQASSNSNFANTASTPEFMSYVNSATAYVPLSALVDASSASSLISEAQSSMEDHANTFKSGGYKGDGNGQVDDTVVEGYKQVYKTITDKMFGSGAGQVELLIALTQEGVIVLQAALQHPLSMGRMYITSASAFDAPVLDPAYLSHPTDLTILRSGFQLLSKLATTAPLSSSMGDATFGPASNSDNDWNTFIQANAGTEYHPTGSCAMMPRSLGGVVDETLKVYGTQNVRVVDASVYPFELASHLGAPTYGVAEIGAQLIRQQYNVGAVNHGNGTGNGTDNGSSASATAFFLTLTSSTSPISSFLSSLTVHVIIMRFFTVVSALAAAGFAAAQEAARFGSVQADPCNFNGGDKVTLTYNATTAIAAGNVPESVSIWIQGTFDDTGNPTPFFRLANSDSFPQGQTIFTADVTVPEQLKDFGVSHWGATAFIIFTKDGLTEFGGISNGCAQ